MVEKYTNPINKVKHDFISTFTQHLCMRSCSTFLLGPYILIILKYAPLPTSQL